MSRLNTKEDYTKPADTVISEGFKIHAAQLTGTDSIRIDGFVQGNIDLDGYLQLSPTGHIDGDVRVSHALIAGRITGNIICRATVHMAATAVVTGDVITSTIIIDDGAVFFGKCQTRSDNGQYTDGAEVLL